MSTFPNGGVGVAAVDVAPSGAHAIVALMYNPGPDPYESVIGMHLADGLWVAGNESYGLGSCSLTFPSLENEGEFISVPNLLGRVAEADVRTAVLRYRDTLLRCPVHEGVYLGVFWEDAEPESSTQWPEFPDSDGPLSVMIEFIPEADLPPEPPRPEVERYEYF